MKNILIIDDNPLNVEDYIEPLKEKYTVTVNVSLKDSYRRIQMNHFDIIVIDIMMPTQWLKNRDELKTGLFFYIEKLRELDKKNKRRYLFWSNLTQDTYDEFFKDGKPDNIDFVHKELRNIYHLYDKVVSMIG